MSDPEGSKRRKLDDDASKTVLLPVAEEPAPATPMTETGRYLTVEVVGGGPMDGLRNRVATPSFTIGRGAGNDLALAQDPMVSSRHARIVREDHHYWLEDLGSRNGVFLGDRRLSQRSLIGPGTTFTLGQTQLEFMPR